MNFLPKVGDYCAMRSRNPSVVENISTRFKKLFEGSAGKEPSFGVLNVIARTPGLHEAGAVKFEKFSLAENLAYDQH